MTNEGRIDHTQWIIWESMMQTVYHGVNREHSMKDWLREKVMNSVQPEVLSVVEVFVQEELEDLPAKEASDHA